VASSLFMQLLRLKKDRPSTDKGQTKHRQRTDKQLSKLHMFIMENWKTKIIKCCDIKSQYKTQTGLKYLLLGDEILCRTKGKKFTWALKLKKKQPTTDE
jgi:hypothetical protein